MKPLHNFVLVERIEDAGQSELIPEQFREKSKWAKVLAVGPGTWQYGKWISTEVKAGQTVYLEAYQDREVDADKKLYLVRETDLLAVK